MRDDHGQLPIQLDHVRAAYQTAPGPRVATSGPKASGALWAPATSAAGVTRLRA